MKFVTKREFEALKKAGLIVESKEEKNYSTTSIHKKAPRGKKYVTETRDIMNFLKNLDK